jgi:hypothetical protein
MKNSNDTIRNQIHDLLACSAVPQPNAPPRTPGANTHTADNSMATLHDILVDSIISYLHGALVDLIKCYGTIICGDIP